MSNRRMEKDKKSLLLTALSCLIFALQLLVTKTPDKSPFSMFERGMTEGAMTQRMMSISYRTGKPDGYMI